MDSLDEIKAYFEKNINEGWTLAEDEVFETKLYNFEDGLRVLRMRNIGDKNIGWIAAAVEADGTILR